MIRTIVALSALILVFNHAVVGAEERPFLGENTGTELATEGATQTVTAPMNVLTNTVAETEEYGVFGLVGGPVRGGLSAGTQMLQGGWKMTVGIMDVLTAPFRGQDPE